MDGMLFVTFFFPALVSFNFTLSIVTFLLSLIVSFGPEISTVVVELVRSNDITKDYAGLVSDWLGIVQHKVSESNNDQALSVFWPIFVSGVTIWTTGSTYGVGGAARYGKKGWKFIQPGVGGIRFVLVQIFTWVSFALSVGMPWTTLEHFGWLTVLGVVPSNQEDPASHRGLLVVGSAMGMLSLTFSILGLMSFDPSEKISRESLRMHRRKFDNGKWKWNIFGDSEAWWWLFLVLQGTLVVFSWQLAVMLEMSIALKNSIVESLLLMVITSLLAVPVALTNVIAGKWKHGEKNYRLTMPFQGGFVFVVLQGLGWALFAGAFLVTLVKLYSTATASGTKISISSTASLGFISYLCIVASLFFFDPSQVHRPAEDASDSEDDAASDDGQAASENKSRQAHSVLGKRQSPNVKGALEYLVQWKATSNPIWILEDILMKEDPDAIKNNEKSVRTPRIGTQTRQRQMNRGRSVSPKRVSAQRLDDEEDDDTDSDSEDVWEEVEDELGNVFYYNERTKLTQTTFPEKLRKALVRQERLQQLAQQ